MVGRSSRTYVQVHIPSKRTVRREEKSKRADIRRKTYVNTDKLFMKYSPAPLCQLLMIYDPTDEESICQRSKTAREPVRHDDDTDRLHAEAEARDEYRRRKNSEDRKIKSREPFYLSHLPTNFISHLANNKLLYTCIS